MTCDNDTMSTLVEHTFQRRSELPVETWDLRAHGGRGGRRSGLWPQRLCAVGVYGGAAITHRLLRDVRWVRSATGRQTAVVFGGGYVRREPYNSK